MFRILIRYLRQHFNFGGLLGGDKEAVPEMIRPRRELSLRRRTFLFILSHSQWLCILGFIVSFFPFGDFHAGDEVIISGYHISLNGLIRTVAVGGLIGFGTNWLAINMLFKPVQRRPVWGQGLIPAQKDKIIEQLAAGIHTYILNDKLIRQRIHDSGVISRLNEMLLQGTHGILNDEAFKREVKEWVFNYLTEYLNQESIRDSFTEHIDTKLKEKISGGFKGFMFKTYKRLNKNDYDMVLNNLIQSIPQTAMDMMERMDEQVDGMMVYLNEKKDDSEKLMTKLVISTLDKIDIYKLLKSQMTHFDESELERLIRNSTDDQLDYIKHLGTILGMLGGLLIWQPVIVLTGYLTILGILYLTDVILFNMKKGKVNG